MATNDDLRVDVFMPLYCRDFLASTLGWSAEEKGHYLTLLMVQWDRGGLPADRAKLERISPGLADCWELIEEKFPVCSDGNRRNGRMEAHRDKCVELKRRRAEAGKRGGRPRSDEEPEKQTESKTKANEKQNESKTQSKPEANGEAKQKPPTPTPTPTPYPPSTPEKNTHTHAREAWDDFPERGSGWAAAEWDRFASRWNTTSRARPWTAFTPPDGWVDYAARPGWLDKAAEALDRLPGCQFFEQPLAVTKFLDFVDRILAGEFDHAKSNGRPRRQLAKGRL